MKLYPWLQPHFKNLITNYQIGYKHHALLIQENTNIGAQELIYSVISYLMCKKIKRQHICGKCRDCQLMKAGMHPNYYVLELKSNDVKFSIDKVLEVTKRLYECTHPKDLKIVWLRNAASLTEMLSNVLLKILEEPPKQTFFFLSCQEPKHLLATLRSRCWLYRLLPPQESYGLIWLNNKIVTSKTQALTALRLHGGSPIAALTFLKPKKRIQRKRFYKLIESAIKNNDWFSLLSTLDNNQILEYLYWFLSLLLDALKIQQDIVDITNIDSRSLVKDLANTFSKKMLINIFQEISQCYKHLLTVNGVNRELLITNQLLHIEYYLQA